jgi:hypothetical protein
MPHDKINNWLDDIYELPDELDTSELIDRAYQIAKSRVDPDAINDAMRMILMKKKFLPEHIQHMVSLGIDIQTSFNDIVEEQSIGLIKFVLENYSIIIDKYAIKIALLCWDSELLRILYEHGADPQIIISSVVKYNLLSKDFIDYILELVRIHGAERTILTTMLTNYLHINRLSLDQIRLLVDSGADPRHNNDNCLTYAYANCKGDLEIVRYFLDNGCVIRPYIFEYNTEANYETTRFLLESTEITPEIIKKLLGKKNLSMAKLLIELGISTDAIIKAYLGTLTEADRQFMNFLVENGGDLNSLAIKID